MTLSLREETNSGGQGMFTLILCFASLSGWLLHCLADCSPFHPLFLILLPCVLYYWWWKILLSNSFLHIKTLLRKTWCGVSVFFCSCFRSDAMSSVMPWVHIHEADVCSHGCVWSSLYYKRTLQHPHTHTHTHTLPKSLQQGTCRHIHTHIHTRTYTHAQPNHPPPAVGLAGRTHTFRHSKRPLHARQASKMWSSHNLCTHTHILPLSENQKHWNNNFSGYHCWSDHVTVLQNDLRLSMG